MWSRAIASFVVIFMVVGLQTQPSGHVADPVILLIRAFGVTAFTLLTVILTIGPLARLSPRFLPALYNRRHLGVTTFIVAFLAFRPRALLVSCRRPAQSICIAFWSAIRFTIRFRAFLLNRSALSLCWRSLSWRRQAMISGSTISSAPVWKALHMLVYPAYALLVMHVVLGALMTEKSLLYPILTGSTFVIVSGLHLYTGLREWRADNGMKSLKAKGWIEIGAPLDIPDMRAVIAPLPKGDRVAVFRYGDKISAVTNACRHQNGPLGEGRVIDGCITCPWHGWQYRPDDGISTAALY